MLAAAVCPHPPLLVPAVAGGAAHELDDVRTACFDVVRGLLALEPDVVVVVGASPVPLEADETAVGSLAGFGIDIRGGANKRGESTAEPSLPLALVVGAWLLDRAGWRGRRRYVGVPDTTRSADAAALGSELAGATQPIAVLVMGDGSARRSTVAPGYLDERAAVFDATVAQTLAAADAEGLLALDATLAIELLAAGRAPWQVLGGVIDADTAATGRSWTGDVLVDTAPYGVGYLVATVAPRPATG